MLRIIQLKSVKLAKQYFSSSLQHGDYYMKGSSQERSGAWGGTLAKELGLEGQVTKEQFFQMCENINPMTGEKLTRRSRANRTPGYDLNFHAPKSVSIVHALTPHKEAVETAFTESVGVAMQELEQVMATRVRKGHVYEDRITGNMAWAEFVHYTARPVDGIPDPHLHAHFIGFNATKDEQEGVIKAGKFTAIKEQAPLFEAVFHTTLQEKLRGLGFGIKSKGKYWEIEGIPESLIGRFSRRSDLIDKVAKEQGIRTDQIKDGLGAKTRQHKAQSYSIEELQNLWSLQLSSKEKEGLQHLTGRVKVISPKTARQALDFAIHHHLERQSVIRRDVLMATALRYGSGVTLEALRAEISERKDLLQAEYKGREYLTTSKVLQEEHDLLGLIISGQGKNTPLNATLGNELNPQLSSEQRDAIYHVMHSKDAVIAIQGGAGTGKTTLMTEAVTQIQKTGKLVFTFAPSAEASKGVLRQEGFDNADTVAQLLHNTKLQEQLKDQVVWIDEAGLLSVPDYTKVLEIARNQNARVIVTGDIRQHGAVSRGEALRLAQNKQALNPVKLETIRRQKDERYKEAVKLMSHGKAEESFTVLDKMGVIHEEIDPLKRYKTIAQDYVDTIKNGQSVLLVAPTHREGIEAMAPIRTQLRQEGLITGEDYPITTRTKRDLTEAQKQDVREYAIGQVIRFHRDNGSYKKGVDYPISDIAKQVLVVDKRGTNSVLPLNMSRDYGVYERRQVEVATGDKIRFTENGKDEGGSEYHNGNGGSVLSVEGEKIQIELENGLRVAVNASDAPLTNGYYYTSYSSQGKTVDRVILAQSSYALPTSSQNQWYVSISRGRESIGIYTDSKQELKEAITYSGDKLLATEVFAKTEKVRKGETSMTPEELAIKQEALKNRMEELKTIGKEPEKEEVKKPQQPTPLELLHRAFKAAGIKPSKDELLTREEWEREKEMERERGRDFER